MNEIINILVIALGMTFTERICYLIVTKDDAKKCTIGIPVMYIITLIAFASSYMTCMTSDFEWLTLLIVVVSISCLLCMSYTDIKTKEVYLAQSLLFVIANAVGLCIRGANFNIFLMMVPILLILLMLSLAGMMGGADVIIFAGVACNYLLTKKLPFESFIITIFISAVLGAVYIIFEKLVNKSKEKHFGFTTCITISFIVQHILSVV